MSDRKRNQSAKAIGDRGEYLAVKYLQDHGFTMVERNVRSEFGEIDLIAEKDGRLHFVEVKTRTTRRFGTPEEAVTPAKLQHMIDAAMHCLQGLPDPEAEWQIDVLAIMLRSGGKDTHFRMIENVS